LPHELKDSHAFWRDGYDHIAVEEVDYIEDLINDAIAIHEENPDGEYRDSSEDQAAFSGIPLVDDWARLEEWEAEYFDLRGAEVDFDPVDRDLV